MFQKNTRKNRFDPYRHGVLVGNYVEDIFGQDLSNKYYLSNESETQNWKFELKSRFLWPNNNDPVIKSSDAKIITNIYNYDLNINFIKANELKQNENIYKLSEKTLKDFKIKNFSVDKNVSTESHRMLNKFHQQECEGVFFT